MDPAKLREDIEFKAELRGHELRFRTTWGLFSPREIDAGTPEVRCEVDVETEIDASPVMRPLRSLLERLLRRVNRRVLEEDRGILERRQRLFGSSVEDYLRDGQFLLFKEAFRSHYSRAPR